MTNSKTAQDRIWAFHDGPLAGYFVGQSPGEGAYVADFIRTDLVVSLIDALFQQEESIVRAALERAANMSAEYGKERVLECEEKDSHLLDAYGWWLRDEAEGLSEDIANAIRALASDPEAVAEIIAAAAKEVRG